VRRASSPAALQGICTAAAQSDGRLPRVVPLRARSWSRRRAIRQPHSVRGKCAPRSISMLPGVWEQYGNGKKKTMRTCRSAHPRAARPRSHRTPRSERVLQRRRPAPGLLNGGMRDMPEGQFPVQRSKTKTGKLVEGSRRWKEGERRQPCSSSGKACARWATSDRRIAAAERGPVNVHKGPEAPPSLRPHFKAWRTLRVFSRQFRRR